MELMPPELRSQFPPLYSQDGKDDDAVVYAKYFYPLGSATWYATEYDPEERRFFGLAYITDAELGYFSLDELESITGAHLPGVGIERDLMWEGAGKTLADARKELESRGYI